MLNKKNILLLLPTGMTIRNILLTNVIKHILEYDNIKIVCCTKNPEKYNQNFKSKKIKFIQFYNKKSFSFSNFLLLILGRRFDFLNINKSREILKKGPINRSWTNYFLNFLSYPFPRNKKIYNFFLQLLNSTYKPLNEIELQFSKYKPDLIFATHIVTKDEIDYIIYGKNKNIPIVGMIKSFDNLSGKGFLPYLPNYAILWNKIMKDELVRMYNFEEKNTFITGIPQFDIYKIKPKISKKQFLKKFKFTEGRKIILFATNHKDLSPDDESNIKFLSINLNKLNASLLVRIHPNDDPNRYKKLKFKNVFFHSPGILEGSNADDGVSYKHFLEDLRDNIYFSDVTINTASTMSLDASALDKPIINIAYDYEKTDYFKSVRRYYDLTHYKTIIETKSTSIARNKDELINFISQYFINPDFKKKERKKLREIMLAQNKGDACKKIANNIYKILSMKK